MTVFRNCAEIINIIGRRFRMEQHQAIVVFKLRKQVKKNKDTILDHGTRLQRAEAIKKMLED